MDKHEVVQNRFYVWNVAQRTKRQDEQRREFMSHELIQIFGMAVIFCSKWRMETRTAAYKFYYEITLIIM